MKFSSSICRILGRHVGADAYLFVDAELGLIIVVYRSDLGSRCGMTGYGIWFYESGDYELVTTIAKYSGENIWLSEYYRIYEDWMQWSNFQADIFHERVRYSEVPEECLDACRRVMERCNKRTKPEYDPDSLGAGVSETISLG